MAVPKSWNIITIYEAIHFFKSNFVYLKLTIQDGERFYLETINFKQNRIVSNY